MREKLDKKLTQNYSRQIYTQHSENCYKFQVENLATFLRQAYYQYPS